MLRNDHQLGGCGRRPVENIPIHSTRLSIFSTCERSSFAVAATLLILAAAVSCCDGQQASCVSSHSQLSSCSCYGLYNSTVYAGPAPAVICKQSAANTLKMEAVLSAITQLGSNISAPTLYTLKIVKYMGTTELGEQAFDAFIGLRELVLMDMPIATIQATAFQKLVNLESLSLVSLRSAGRGLGHIDFAGLLPNSNRLRIVDLSNSAVTGIAKGSFGKKNVTKLLLSSADMTSLTVDLLDHVTTISLSGNNWNCNKCLCPLTTKASSITWLDRNTSVCGGSSPATLRGIALVSLIACGCSPTLALAAASYTKLCSETGDLTCSGSVKTLSLDCKSPDTSQPSCTTTPEEDTALGEKIKDFFTSIAGTITLSVFAVLLVAAFAICIACCYWRRLQRKVKQADDARRLLRALRTNSLQRGELDGGEKNTDFPEFGMGTEGLLFEEHQPGSIMAAITDIFGEDVGTQKKLPTPAAKSSGKDQGNDSSQSGIVVSPPRSLSCSRTGSMLSRTSLRHQPIWEEDEDGDPVE